MKKQIYFYCILALSSIAMNSSVTARAARTTAGTCAICSEPLKNPVTLECGHRFNRACMNKRIKKHNKTCPTCHAKTNYLGDTKGV